VENGYNVDREAMFSNGMQTQHLTPSCLPLMDASRDQCQVDCACFDIGTEGSLQSHFPHNVTATIAEVGHIKGTVTVHPAHVARYHVLCEGRLVQTVWCSADGADHLQRVQIGSSCGLYTLLAVSSPPFLLLAIIFTHLI
jgi:hypothetical protein